MRLDLEEGLVSGQFLVRLAAWGKLEPSLGIGFDLLQYALHLALSLGAKRGEGKSWGTVG